MKSRYLCILLALIVAPLSACGGGGGGGDDQQFNQQQIVINVTRALSGYLSENGFESAGSDTFVGTIPDISGFLEQRGIFYFDLSAIPAGSVLLDAQLRSLQGPQTGTPYAQVVQVIVDHLNGNTGGIDFVDFNAAPLSFIATPLSTNPVEEVKTLDVTVEIAADLAAGRAATKFRLRGQAINPLTAGNNDPVDPVDLARFQTDITETQLVLTVNVPVP